MQKKVVISESGVKVFSAYKDNISIDKDNPALKKKAEYLREKYTRGKVKGLSRLGSENSEDARSWDLFRTLQLHNDMKRYYGLIGIQDEFERILFWGLDPDTAEFDGDLKSVLDDVEPPDLWKLQQTEPDMILIGKVAVVFNECKLGKPGNNIDAWNRKEEFSAKHKLYKAKARLFFKQLFIEDFEEKGRRYYQLMRNYIIGRNLANRLKKEFHLVVIVSEKNSARSGLTHQEEFKKFCSNLLDSSRCHFLTWDHFKG
jgi:hypothetical protein